MYKLYQSKKPIPWVSPLMDNTPNVDIDDNYFNYEEIPTNTLNFIKWDQGSIVVYSNDITYFKLVNTTTNETKYWYVNKIEKVLKEGYMLQLSLDIYMTYTRRFIKELDSVKPLIERVYFNRKMFKTNEELRHLIYYSFKVDDEIIKGVDLSTNQLDTLAYEVSNTKLPWNGSMGRMYYSGSTNQDYYFDDVEINTDSVNENRYTFDYNYGYYVVMLRGKEGIYDFYPINNETFYFKPKWNKNINNNAIQKGKIANDLRNLFFYVVNRNPSKGNSPWFNDIKTEGIKDIQTIYQEGSFQGIYRAPKMENTQKFKMRSWFNYDGTNYHWYSTMYYEVDSMKPFNLMFPSNLLLDNDLIEYYITYSEYWIWGETMFQPVKYTYMYENTKPQNLETDGNLFKPSFSCSFIGEVIAIPTSSSFSSLDDIISFGREIPSPSSEYADQQRKIKQTYDTGLTNAIIGSVQGIPSAIGKGVASPWWGISSLIGSGLTLARDLKNLSMNRSNSLANITASYITTTKQDYFTYTTFIDAFKNHPMLDMYQVRPNQLHLWEPLMVKTFTNSQKEQLRFILQNYGFKLNMCLPFLEWYKCLGQRDVAFIQFNEEWLNTSIPQLNKRNWNKEIQEAVKQQLSNGIRMHMEWK